MKSPCLEPRCGSFATYRGRCPAHSKERDRTIDRAGRATYGTRRWQLTRRRKLNETPICERCDQELADTVHHKVDIAEGGDEWAMANLESCCASCHSKITRRTQLERTT